MHEYNSWLYSLSYRGKDGMPSKWCKYQPELQKIPEMTKRSQMKSQNLLSIEKKRQISKVERIKQRVAFLLLIIGRLFSIFFICASIPAIFGNLLLPVFSANTDFPLTIVQHTDYDKFIISISSYFAHIKNYTDLDSFWTLRTQQNSVELRKKINFEADYSNKRVK